MYNFINGDKTGQELLREGALKALIRLKSLDEKFDNELKTELTEPLKAELKTKLDKLTEPLKNKLDKLTDPQITFTHEEISTLIQILPEDSITNLLKFNKENVHIRELLTDEVKQLTDKANKAKQLTDEAKQLTDEADKLVENVKKNLLDKTKTHIFYGPTEKLNTDHIIKSSLYLEHIYLERCVF